MTLKELEARVKSLEKEVADLRSQLPKRTGNEKPDYWWRDPANRITNDEAFDEIVRLGREYRESLRPDWRKKKPRVKKKLNGRA